MASGRATLYSSVINHRLRRDIGTEPHSIAVVSLAEGPRMMTNIVNCPQTPEALPLDMPLRVIFAPQNEEITLPFFPRAYARTPLTIDELMDSAVIAWPFRKSTCCLVTDGGGALILTSAERARHGNAAGGDHG